MKFEVFQTITTKLIVEAEDEDAAWDGDCEILWEKEVHGEIDSVEEYAE